MSQWRLDLKYLAEIGGAAARNAFCGHDGIGWLLRFGLVECIGKEDGHNGCKIYEITQRGRDLLDGRIAYRVNGPSPASWCATWLQSLPRAGEIRLPGPADNLAGVNKMWPV